MKCTDRMDKIELDIIALQFQISNIYSLVGEMAQAVEQYENNL